MRSHAPPSRVHRRDQPGPDGAGGALQRDRRPEVNNWNWLTDELLGVWYGVDTDAAGRVVRIDLAGQWDNETQEYIPHGLRGELPAELENLTELTTLSLSGNNLTGPIPPELGSLTKLTSLELSHNDLPDQVRRSLTTEHGPKEDISIALKGDISTAVRQRPSCKPFVRQFGPCLADKPVPGEV